MARAQPHATAASGSGDVGYPLLTTYKPHEHGAEPQNWSIAQTTDGLLYFGNTGGVVEFDGVSWRIIPVSNDSAVRSVEVCSDGRVYVGAQGDFGYLAPDETGQLRFVSLRHALAEDARAFTDVWTIACRAGEVVFHTVSQLMRWNGTELRVMSPAGRFYLIHEIDGRVYVPDTDRGLFTLEADSLRLIDGGDYFVGDDLVVTMAPFDGGILVTTIESNAYVLRDGGREPFELPAPLLRNSQIYHSTALSDGSVAFATPDHGVFIIGSDGRLLQHLDRHNGLQHGTTFHVFEDRESNLWIAENEGVTRVAWPPVLSVFDARNGLATDIADVRRYRGVLYAASSTGTVQRLDTAQRDRSAYPAFTTLPGLRIGMWSLLEHRGALLMAGQGQIWRMQDGRIEPLVETTADVPRIFYQLYPSRSDSSVVYVGSNEGVYVLRDHEGAWSIEEHPDGPDAEVRSLAETAEATLIVANQYGGVLKIPMDGVGGRLDRTRPVIVGGDTLRNGMYRLYDDGGRIYLMRTAPPRDEIASAILLYDEATARFEPATALGADLLSPERTVFRMHEDGEGNLWMRTQRNGTGENGVALRRADGTYHWYTRPFAVMPDITVHAVFPDGDSLVWLATDRQLFRYDRRLDDTTRYARSFKTLIRRVTLRQDSVLFGGTATEAYRVPTLEARSNDLRFEFAALSHHDGERNHYQVHLDGLSDGWSAWSEETWKDYTSLPAGRYRFRVRGRNVYGVVSNEAVFEFRILPPWYQTWWAYGLYALFALGTFIPTTRYLSYRRLQRRVRALETERRLHEERERISRDLHDNVGAQLTNILSGIELIHLSTKAGEHERASAYLASLEADAHESMRQLRETIWALHLDRISVAAFRDQIQHFVATQLRYRERPVARVTVYGDEATALSPIHALHLYRIAQEAIHNALKYANAEQLHIELRTAGRTFELTVRDDGTFHERNEEERERRYGLEGMRRRAEEIGGRFKLDISNGTTVTVRVKLAEEPDQRQIPGSGY